MRCKVGDLAIYVGGRTPRGTRVAIDRHLGRLFEVLGPLLPDGELPMWEVRPVDGSNSGECHDLCLRPIRDPGDDARDEMLRPLPNEVTA